MLLLQRHLLIRRNLCWQQSLLALFLFHSSVFSFTHEIRQHKVKLLNFSARQGIPVLLSFVIPLLVKMTLTRAGQELENVNQRVVVTTEHVGNVVIRVGDCTTSDIRMVGGDHVGKQRPQHHQARLAQHHSNVLRQVYAVPIINGVIFNALR